MSTRIMIIALVVAAIAVIILMSRPFQATVVEEQPGQAPRHAVDQ